VDLPAGRKKMIIIKRHPILITLILSLLFIVLSCGSSEFKPFTEEQICKACISSIMHAEPATMKIYKKEKGITYLYYKKPGDPRKWANKCKIEKDRVNQNYKIIWGNANGRWRTHPDDGKVTFMIYGEKIEITEKHGSSEDGIRKLFTLQELGG